MNQHPAHLPNDADELLVLAQSFCDGTLGSDDADRLEQLLLSKPLQQRKFLAHVDLHARLCWEAGHGVPATHPTPDAVSLTPSAISKKMNWPAWAAVAACLLLLLSGILWKPEWLTLAARQQHHENVVKVVHAVGVSSAQAATLAPGKEVLPGTLELPHGIVELAYSSGVRLLVESPARLELIDAGHAFLHSGRLVARVPKPAIGYVVESARARIVDLGTEFGVSVAPEGATLVQVYEGAIDAELKVPDGKRQATDRLTTGQAIAMDASAEPLKFAPHRFVRSFPVEPKESEPVQLSNRSQQESVRVRRVGSAPAIDGDLSDWSEEGSFTSRCNEPNGERYFIESRLRFDDSHLYFAAHVGDPLPMSSTVDAAEDPTFYWTGGSVVLRVAANGAFGWPLQAVRPKEPEREISQQDGSNQIVHIGMWYSKRIQEPQMMLAYGMDCHNQGLRSEGWQGAFRKDADGHGYTMEYAIELRLLNVDRAPHAGDVWPANLNVHWSNRDGRTCMGVLSEITNQSSPSYNPFQGPSWGKLVFED